MGKPVIPVKEKPQDDSALLRLIAGHLPAMSVAYDPNLLCVFSTRRLAEFFGLTVESIVGKHLREIIGEGPYQEVKPHFDRVLDGQRVTYARVHVLDSGELRHLEIEAIPCIGQDGRLQGLFIFTADVSERKRTEDALRKSEEHFRGLIELSSDRYWEQDENFRFTRFSSGLVRGRTYDERHLLGKTRWELDLRLEPGQDMAAHRATLAAHLPFHDFEYAAMIDGSLAYFSASGVPLFDGQGQFIGYRGVGSNITARKQTEKALQQSEQRFRDLTEVSSDWYWEQDDQFRFTYRSPDIHGAGMLVEEVIGKRRWELEGVEANDALWASHKATLEAHQPFREFEFRRRDSNGALRYISVSGIPLFSAEGVFLGHRGVVRNITERKLAEQALRESEARLREAQRLARLGSWEWDLVNGGLTWSEEIFRIFEIDPERVGASREVFLAVVHPADRDAVNEAYQRSVRERTPYEITHRLLLADGRIKHVHEHGLTVYDERGQPLRTVGTVQDVSEQKQAEAELRTYADRLQQMAGRLGEAQEVERRRLAAELHDGVGSHLAAIGLNVALLQKQLQQGDTASMQRRLSDLIVLVDQAKVNAKEISVDLRPLLLENRDLFPALEEYARKFGRSFGIAVQMKGGGSDGRLSAEKKIALFRIAQEALTNCVKHARANVVTIEFNSHADHLLLSVADDGVGIDFAGINGSSKGLGLLLMQERAESIGGRFQIESAPGKGTRMSVSLGAVLT